MQDGSEKTLVDPVYIANILDMNALVYYADSVDFSREMSYLCMQEDMGCYSGSVRVYATYPKLNEKGESRRHILFTPLRIQEMMERDEESFYQMLRRALVEDVHFYDTLFSVEDCRHKRDAMISRQQMLDLKKREEEAKEKAGESSAAAEEFLNSAAEMEQQNKELQNQLLTERIYNEDLTEKLKEEERNTRCAQNLADQYMEKACAYDEAIEALEKIRGFKEYPHDAKSVVKYYEIHYPDRITFTDRAKKSLNDCITRPETVWSALYALVDIFYTICKDQNCTDIGASFNAQCSNFKYKRGEGMMTHRDRSLMKQYEDVYQGRTIDVESHIACGNDDSNPRCIRIYLCYDARTEKVVVSHIGKHLDNYSTQKI
jgi:hypothetical protein